MNFTSTNFDPNRLERMHFFLLDSKYEIEKERIQYALEMLPYSEKELLVRFFGLIGTKTYAKKGTLPKFDKFATDFSYSIQDVTELYSKASSHYWENILLSYVPNLPKGTKEQRQEAIAAGILVRKATAHKRILK